MYEEITKHTQVVVSELLEQAKLKPGSLFVVGCSSSEMVGKRIGKGSSMDAAKAAFLGVYPLLQKAGIHLAVQCCEHLNLALIMERTAAEAKGYEIVNVMPHPTQAAAWLSLPGMRLKILSPSKRFKQMLVWTSAVHSSECTCARIIL